MRKLAMCMLLTCCATSAETVQAYQKIWDSCARVCTKQGADPNIILSDAGEVICLCKTRCAEERK